MKNTFTEPRKRRPCFSQNYSRALIMRVSQVYILILTSSILTMAGPTTKGQGIEDTKVNLEILNKPLKEVFMEIEKQTDFQFHAQSKTINKFKNISLPKGTYTVKEVLDHVLAGTGLKFSETKNYVIISSPDEKKPRIEKSEAESKTSIPARDKEAEANEEPLALITGTVKDASNQQPLAGVNIIVKGTTKGTTTDADGKFGIEAEDNDILVFSFIGFKAFETQVNGRSVIDVSMEDDVLALEEVVVNAGYYQVKQKEQTGNISRITAEEISRQSVNNPLETLHGRMPGVYVSQVTGVPGSDFNIKIRGTNSLRTEANNPLYIVDGMPFSFETLSSRYNTSGILGTGSNPLNGINPADIESIEVLKDADATAIYGSRGANGVVLITTKKGKSGKTQVDINVNSGVGRVSGMMDLLNTAQYLEMREEAYLNDGIATYPPNAYDVNGTWEQNRFTDWQKELIGGTARTTNAQVSLSGGNEGTQFLFSGGYLKQTTVFPGDYAYKKASAHFSVNHLSPNKKLSFSTSTTYVNNLNNQPYTDLTNLIYLPPNAPKLYNEGGTLNWENSTWQNPLRELERFYESKIDNFIWDAKIEYAILPDLKVKTNFGFNNMQAQEISAIPSTYYNPALGLTSVNATTFLTTGNLQSWIVEPQINWKKKIASGMFDVLAGATIQDQVRKQYTVNGTNFPSDALIKSIRAASSTLIYNDNNTKYKYGAIFGRLNYNWKEKYVFNITGRRDGSSRFGPGKQFATFGAIGAAWIFSNEQFIKSGLSFLSFGKVRTSYGTTGNDQIPDYGFLDVYSVGAQYKGITGLKPTSLFNPDFAWEINRKFEAGLELGFMEDRITLSLSHYSNRSSNQLVNYTLPKTTGFTGILTNLNATVENTGLEAELNTVNFQKNSLVWTTSINLTVPRNRLTNFPGLQGSPYERQYVIGEPLDIRFGYGYSGIDPVSGAYLFEDFNGDGQITFPDDYKAIMRFNQTYYGGVNNSFTYKGLELSIFFQFVNQNGQLPIIGTAPGTLSNKPLFALDRWQGEGDVARFQRFTSGTNSLVVSGQNRFSNSDAVVTDASFIRLKNVLIAYRFPQQLLSGMRLRLYFQGQNLLTMTKYEGLDPETTYTRLPPLKVFTAGAQLTF